MKKYNAHILAVTNSSVQAFAGDVANSFIPLIANESGFATLPFGVDDVIVASRDVLERDTNYRQVIPYVLIERGGKFLAYRRTKKGGESRLHDQISLGIGGHIDARDIALSLGTGEHIDLEGTIGNAMTRELREELRFDKQLKIEVALGFIVDNSTAVNAVHVGLVLIAKVDDSGMVLSNDDSIDLIGFKSIDELTKEPLESWSKIVIDHLISTSHDQEVG